MSTVCRLCLRKDANFAISNGQVAVKILSCTGLEIDPNDKLPQLICQVCRLHLEEFHYFRKRCHAADRRLRQLTRLGRSFDHESNLLDGDKSDVLLLKDVANCTPTACSESNARWRREAAQMIRREIDTHKSDLVVVCKQQVREEIEQQVRNEVENLIIADVKKKCQLKVLDDLFYEIETWFVHKRNSVARSQAFDSDCFLSDMDAAEMESASTITDQIGSSSELMTNAESVNNLNNSTESLVEVIETVPSPIHQPTSGSSASAMELIPTSSKVLPMVEINMGNSQYSHLREYGNTANFLSTKDLVSPVKTPRVRHKEKQLSRIQLRDRICQIHGTENEKIRNCLRCRLRGSLNTKKNTK
ncbi:uncharacterized protein LOC6573455 [Drosophila mojavensis]|uniref:ZAD domain-containing protein n=1 Tax=Drosophila mojavensis TaxID=7230 RepID=B4K4M1_DROMO|nr:uncharacterized protein LOC6573455 [Drosophila mojavensis]EDW14997.2 uncharacterized protein Dmoj_GI24575 [Drosophila mojavensis]